MRACHDAETVPSAAALSQALTSCSERTLRLGFHAASQATNRAAAHGVSAAMLAILTAGGMVNASFKPVNAHAGEAIRAALELMQVERVHAIVGGGMSSITAVAQSTFSLALVPQVAYSSTTSFLSDQYEYPTFSRVVPADDYQGIALSAVCRSLGWKRIAIISTNDNYGHGLAATLIDGLAQFRGYPLVSVTFEASTHSDLHNSSVRASVKTVVASGSRIIALLASSVEAAQSLLREVAAQELNATFLAPDGWLTPAFLDGNTLLVDAIGTNPRSPTEGSEYELFLRYWRDAPSVPHPDLACGPLCRDSPGWAGMYAYDAVRLIYRAWSILQASGASPCNLSSRALLGAIRSVGLPDGLTSNLSMREDGELIEGSFDLVQLSHSASAGMSIKTVGFAYGQKVTWHEPLQLSGGGIPLDGSEPSPLTSHIIFGDWQEAVEGSQVTAVVSLKDSFDEPVDTEGDNFCLDVSAHLVRPSTNEVIGKYPGKALLNGSTETLCSITMDAPRVSGTYHVVPYLGTEVIDAESVVVLQVLSRDASVNAFAFLGVAFGVLFLVCLFGMLWLWQKMRFKKALESTLELREKELLALFCNPRLNAKEARQYGFRPLSLGQELKHLLRAMPPQMIAIEPAATLLDAQMACLEHRPRMLSFSGHSTVGGMLAFEDDKGRLDLHTDPDKFARLITGQLEHSQGRYNLPPSFSKKSGRNQKPSKSRAILPKSRQPGELAGWHPLMGEKSLLQQVQQSKALNDRHKVICGLRDRDEAIVYLRKLGKPKGRQLSPNRIIRTRSNRSDGGGTIDDASLAEVQVAGKRSLTSTSEADIEANAAPQLQVAIDDSFLDTRRQEKKYRHLVARGGFRVAHVKQKMNSDGFSDVIAAMSQIKRKALPKQAGDAPDAMLDKTEVRQTMLQLECVFLLGCDTEVIARRLLEAAPSLTVVCWSTLAEDSATRSFAKGFYTSLAYHLEHPTRKSLLRFFSKPKPLLRRTIVEQSFFAACHSFVDDGFTFGDPREFLHQRPHPHLMNPQFTTCPGCTPPVHGLPVLLKIDEGELCVVKPPNMKVHALIEGSSRA